MEKGALRRVLGEQNVVGTFDEPPDDVVKSAGRVFRILELFDVLQREALVSQICGILHLPQSSTSALLHSMVELGYLYFNPVTRAYRPTTRVALLGSWIHPRLVNSGRLIGLIEHLNELTGQAIVLAARKGVWSEYIHIAQSAARERLFLVKGARRPLACSTTGLVFLAGLSDVQIKRIAVRANAELPHRSPISISGLLAEVETVRACGYAFTCDKVTSGAGMIAMQLPLGQPCESLALGLAASTEDLKENCQSYVTAMREEIIAHQIDTSCRSL